MFCKTVLCTAEKDILDQRFNIMLYGTTEELHKMAKNSPGSVMAKASDYEKI